MFPTDEEEFLPMNSANSLKYSEHSYFAPRNDLIQAVQELIDNWRYTNTYLHVTFLSWIKVS